MKTIFTWFAFLVVTSSITAQWVRQHPFPKLENINDIEINNEGLGFAVGDNAMIFQTFDGGDHWDWLEAPIEGWDLKTIEIWNNESNKAALIGGNGLLLSKDNGMTWTKLMNAPQDILELEIIDENRFLAITTLGVFKTEDEGLSWSDLNLSVTAIQDAHILDEMHMWVSSILPEELWTTSNGGATWTNTTEVVRHDLVHFFDSDNGLLVDVRDVYQSQDGGQTWSLISNNGLQSNAFHLDFGTDKMHVFAALNGGRINYSIDGGVTWEKTNFTNIPHGLASSVFAFNNSEVFYGGTLSSILKSTDQLQSIKEVTGGSRRSITEVDMKNIGEGIAAGTHGTLLKTIDGGQNWVEMETELRNYLGIDFVADNNIWAGSNQRILHSTDGGATWNEKLVLANSNIQDVEVIGDSTIVGVSTNGVIYRSTDYGMVWDTNFYDVSNNGRFTDIEFTDAVTGYVCGFNGRLLKTTNGGSSWTTLTAPVPDLQYEDFYFLTNDEGWLVSSSYEDRMWRTVDGGVSWETLQLPTLEFWTGVHFISPDTGVVVHRGTNRGGVYITFDGGKTWPSVQETNFPYNGVSGTTGQNASIWIFGSGGNIEALLNCEAIPSINELVVEEIFPCQGDTISVEVQGVNLDAYVWSFPAGWMPIGTVDTSSIFVVANGSFGYISVFGKNECGSTSILDQQVSTALPPDIFIEMNNDSLLELSDEANGYQWYLNGFPISGATMPFYIAQETGQYFCEVFSINGCNNFTDTVDVSMIVTNTFAVIRAEIQIQPIPANDYLTIESDVEWEEVRIYNLQGELIDLFPYSNNGIDLTLLGQGTYIFSFLTVRGVFSMKVPIIR